MGGVAGFGKEYFPAGRIKTDNLPQSFCKAHRVFRRKPRFAFRFALPLPSLGFLQKNKNRPPAQKPEVFDFTMADRLLGKRQWANLASSKGKFTFLPYKICVLSKCKNRLNARGSLCFHAAKKTLGADFSNPQGPFLCLPIFPLAGNFAP